MSLLRALIAITLGAGLLGGLALGSGLRAGAQEAPGTPTPTSDPGNFQGPSWAGLQVIRQMQGLPPEAPVTAFAPSQVPPPAGAAGAAGVDVLVEGDPALQNETTLAVRGSTLCAGYNDFGPGAVSGLSRSPDLGTTWNDQIGLGFSGDPAIAVHEATGTFYYAQLSFVGQSSIAVSRSTDDCQTFPTYANASPTTSNASDFQDKPWIAVDNTGGARDGHVYVCWTRFDQIAPGFFISADIRFSRSTDGGLTFGDEQTMSAHGEVFPFGCHIDVGPNGGVSVAWSDRDLAAPILFRRSLDGGITWSPHKIVNDGPIRQAGTDRPVNCGGEIFPRPTLNGDIRMLAQAWMAVDTTGGPYGGNIYVVWAHDPLGLVDNSDVYFARSRDGGQTWSPAVQLAGGTVTDQFEPFVEVGANGSVSIAWYDRRNDPANNYLIDVYATLSRDGGATFDPIERITDVSFPPITYSCYMGEYIAVAADESSFYYLWGDNRNGQPDVYFDKLEAPAAIPPTPTPTPTATRTPTPTPRPVGGVSLDVGRGPSEDTASWSAAATVLVASAVATSAGAVWFALSRRVR